MEIKKLEISGDTGISWKIRQPGKMELKLAKHPAGEWFEIATTEWFITDKGRVSQQRTSVTLNADQLAQLRDFLNS